MAADSDRDFFHGSLTDVVIPEYSKIGLEDALEQAGEEAPSAETEGFTLRLKQRSFLFFGKSDRAISFNETYLSLDAQTSK